MSELLIQFDESLGLWSPFIYWFVVVNTILCAVGTLVVIVGGFFDLRFLFKALKEEVVDETDDGRVVTPSDQAAPDADTENRSE